jgi:hypothetical protein
VPQFLFSLFGSEPQVESRVRDAGLVAPEGRLQLAADQKMSEFEVDALAALWKITLHIAQAYEKACDGAAPALDLNNHGMPLPLGNQLLTGEADISLGWFALTRRGATFSAKNAAQQFSATVQFNKSVQQNIRDISLAKTQMRTRALFS